MPKPNPSPASLIVHQGSRSKLLPHFPASHLLEGWRVGGLEEGSSEAWEGEKVTELSFVVNLHLRFLPVDLLLALPSDRAHSTLQYLLFLWSHHLIVKSSFE